ncbi:RNA polymerase sporulation sigma factor SigK, partial [Vallitalea okinawensis]|uniref:RNA polymerase sporulation sigma factor SigK n=1 Tax=Vallitalea okinawensis TaxID=2078660 RepID=UPI001FA9340F
MWLYIIQYIFAIFYISGNQVFPKPLSADEERHYLERYKDGDEEAKNILIERNLRLVAHIVKKYNNVNKDMDDLISIGTIGLIKAISTYNVDKGTRLATYAARCIENELLMMLRSDKKQKNEVSLQEPIGIDKEGNAITLNDILKYDNESVLDQVDIKMKIRQLYEKMKEVLKAREQMVLEMRYGLKNGVEKTQREVAQELGISRSYVSRI